MGKGAKIALIGCGGCLGIVVIIGIVLTVIGLKFGKKFSYLANAGMFIQDMKLGNYQQADALLTPDLQSKITASDLKAKKEAIVKKYGDFSPMLTNAGMFPASQQVGTSTMSYTLDSPKSDAVLTLTLVANGPNAGHISALTWPALSEKKTHAGKKH